jgi:hypothetical protein
VKTGHSVHAHWLENCSSPLIRWRLRAPGGTGDLAFEKMIALFLHSKGNQTRL